MEKTSIANKLGMIKDAPYDVNDDVNYLIKDMNKDEAIEIIKDFIHTIKQTYPNIAFGSYAGGFCTTERHEDKDKTYSNSDKKRYICWPSCNECAFEIMDGYSLLNKALKVIKGKNNEEI